MLNTAEITFATLADQLVAVGRDGADSSTRVAFLASISDAASKGEWASIDTVLANVSISDLAETSIMTLLRGTYRFREKLNRWQEFRSRASAEFDERQADSQRLLMGI